MNFTNKYNDVTIIKYNDIDKYSVVDIFERNHKHTKHDNKGTIYPPGIRNDPVLMNFLFFLSFMIDKEIAR